MVVELKDAADRYRLLEEESRAKATDLEKARVVAKEARSKIKATKEELNQAADIVSGKPFLLRTKFRDPKYAPNSWCTHLPNSPNSLSDPQSFWYNTHLLLRLL